MLELTVQSNQAFYFVPANQTLSPMKCIISLEFTNQVLFCIASMANSILKSPDNNNAADS